MAMIPRNYLSREHRRIITIQRFYVTSQNPNATQRKQHIFGYFPPTSRLLNRHEDLSANSFQKIQIRFWSARLEDYDFSHFEAESPKVLNDDLFLRTFGKTDDGDPIEDATLELTEVSTSIDAQDNDMSRRWVLVESLAKDVAANVQEIISRIDRHHSRIIEEETDDPDQAGEQPPQKNTDVTEKSLSDRWNDAVRIEKRRRDTEKRRRDSDSLNGMKSHEDIDKIWSQALQPAGLDILFNKDAVSDRDLSFQKDGHDSPSTTAEDDTSGPEPKTGHALSPIFRLATDERGKILESTIPALLIEKNCEIDLQLQDGDSKHDGILSGLALAGPDLPEEEPETLTDTFQHVVALFVSAKPNDWSLIKCCHESNSQETIMQLDYDEQPPPHSNDGSVSAAQELLDYAKNNRLMLTPDENNLLLASLLTSNVISEDDILEKSLQLFNEILRFDLVGIDEWGPNATTYRLMFLALPRRLNAYGEAAIICRSLIQASVKLNTETLKEAMIICQYSSDLDTASKLMAQAMNPNSTLLPNVQSCTAFIQILKDKNMINEAIDFYGRIHESKTLWPHIEEKLLIELCDWPKRTRRGDVIDCSLLLLRILDALFERVEAGQRPQLKLWVALIKRLGAASKLDPSLEVAINRAFYGILEFYHEAWPGNDLLRICLRTSAVTNDSGLISALIAREVQTKRERQSKRQPRIERNVDDDSPPVSAIPLMVFKKSLEMSLKSAHTQAAASILTSLESVHSDYPASAKAELYDLGIRCYTRAARSKEAEDLLLSLVEKGIHVSTDSFGAVIHNLVINGNAEEARRIFQSMEDKEKNMPNPGVSSYNAILASHIKALEWDQAICLFDVMNDKGVAPNSKTIKGLLLAHMNRGGSKGATAFLESMVTIQAPIDGSTFQLAARFLLPALGGKNVGDIRRKARTIGESEPRLRDVSIQMIRSARDAEVDDKKLQAKQSGSNDRGKVVPSEFWKKALLDLLDFSREVVKISAKKD